jgi:uncharacterized RDD family membrane protein YckC
MNIQAEKLVDIKGTKCNIFSNRSKIALLGVSVLSAGSPDVSPPSIVALAYFPVLERLYGHTLGKAVCRIRVVDAAGHIPSWRQSIMRTLWRLFEVNPIFLGGVPAGIVVLASKTRQRLADKEQSTFAVREEDYQLILTSPRSAVPGAAASPTILALPPGGSRPQGSCPGAKSGRSPQPTPAPRPAQRRPPPGCGRG